MARIDIAVYNKSHQLILTVEVKNRFGATTDWAARFRRNLLAHGLYPKAKFFLLVTPENFFLWAGENNSLVETPPNYEAGATEILSPYFERVRLSPKQLNEAELEMLVATWINDLLFPVEGRQTPEWLIKSGLAKAIRGGVYKFEDPLEFAA